MAAAELLQLTSRPKDSSNKWFEKDVDSDHDIDSDNESGHEELMKNIKLLDKKNKKEKRYKGPLRSESSQQVSEFNLKSEGDDGKVNLGDLVGSLQTSSYHSKLKKSLESMQKMGKTVEVPLAKPTAQRIQRVVAYEETSKDITKWDPTVQKNRQAEHLSFPLEPYKPAAMSTGTLATSLKPQTPLEQEIAMVLQSNSHMLERNNKELSQEEEEALKTMSLEEALERRKELQKLRALQSYYEQKCRRMKKIKSKKYHRIKRKAEKRAASKHTFEQLQEENPELAKTELEKAERLRAAERMSLKHRNTSKWAKNIITKGIKDVQTQQALAEQLRISRQLTETKTAQSDSDDDAAEDNAENPPENTDNIRNFGLVGDNNENPWLLNDGKTTASRQEQDGSQEKSEERIRKLHPITAKDTKQDGESNESDGEEGSTNSEEDETFELIDEKKVKENAKKAGKLKGKKVTGKKKKERTKLKEKGKERKEKKTEDKASTKRKIPEEIKEESKTRKKRKKRSKLNTAGEKKDDVLEDMQQDRALLIENDGSEVVELGIENEQQKEDEKMNDSSKVSEKNVNLNLKKVFQIEDLDSPRGLLLDYTNDGSDDEIHAQRMTIQEAFANDDVIEEFVKEKEDAVETGKPKDLDTSLPGWGDWGGPGVDETKRKRKFVEKAKPARPRKDAKMAHVIINEEKNAKFTKNQVTALPFPYTSREQWERSIRTPLGKHWNTASVHNKLVKPRVTTLPGTIIEPIKPTRNIERARVENDTVEQKHGEKKRVQRMDSGIKIHA